MLGLLGTTGQCEGVVSELGIRSAAAPGGRLRRHHLHALHRRREGQGTGIIHSHLG